MGMAERIMYNFENVTLEYNGKKFYILKQFEYKNKMYLYGVDVETAKLGDPNKCEFVFLYRVRDDIFNHVEDPDLFDELFDVVAPSCVVDSINNSMKQN